MQRVEILAMEKGVASVRAEANLETGKFSDSGTTSFTGSVLGFWDLFFVSLIFPLAEALLCQHFQLGLKLAGGGSLSPRRGMPGAINPFSC